MRAYLVFLLIIGLFLSACSKSTQQVGMEASTEGADAAEEVTEGEAAALLGEVKISTSQASYAMNEAIPIELTLKVGKFDLLVPRRYVEGDGAFANLTVSDADGSTVQPRQIIAISDSADRLFYEGQTIRAMSAIELESGKEYATTLTNLRELYNLPSGQYQVQVSMRIPVYDEPKIPRQSPAIAQIEEEIALLRRDTKLAESAKSDAIAALRQQIQQLRAAAPPEEAEEYYLNISNLRGYAELESNILEFEVP